MHSPSGSEEWSSNCGQGMFVCLFQPIIQSKGDVTELYLLLEMVIYTLIKLAENELDLVQPRVRKQKDHEI